MDASELAGQAVLVAMFSKLCTKSPWLKLELDVSMPVKVVSPLMTTSVVGASVGFAVGLEVGTIGEFDGALLGLAVGLAVVGDVVG